MIVAAVVSAAKPWTGSSLTTRWPIVLMIRQPPTAVPSDIAVAATHDDPERDRRTSGMTPAVNRARVMMPIVFWASFDAVAEGHERRPRRPGACRNRSFIAARSARRKTFSSDDHEARTRS